MPDPNPIDRAIHATANSPFIQNVLPWLTSLAFHAAVLAVGLLMYQSVKVLMRHQVQTTAADTPILTPSIMAGLNDGFVGDENNPSRQSVQDKTFDPTATGASWDRGSDRASLRSFTSASDSTPAPDDPLIGIGPSGRRASESTGTTGEGGALAQFGLAPQFGGGSKVFRPGPLGGDAKSVAFLCDASGSMLAKFDDLRRELNKAIQGLKPVHSFAVHFFSDTRARSFSPNLVIASPENKLRALAFMEDVAPRGTTDPLPALELAFREKPQLIFLLTDGDFPDNAAVLARIRRLNADGRVRINTIAFVGADDTDTAFIALLKQIAAENGGVYRHVSQDDLR